MKRGLPSTRTESTSPPPPRGGKPVLGGVHRWSDDEGVIEFGLWVVPTRVTIGYQYDA
ncbi:hypothetical protein KPATCC21470_1320 [Kitasatospora purpeofusca]